VIASENELAKLGVRLETTHEFVLPHSDAVRALLVLVKKD
jgi:hypothetical protein